MVRVIAVMATFFKRTCTSMSQLPGLLYSVPLTPQQASIDPHLHQRLLDTHRKVCLSLFWGHCSSLLGPGVHNISFVSSRSLFPLSSGNSVVRSHWPSKSNSLGILSPFAGSSAWEICCWPQNFFGVIVLQFVGSLLGDYMVGLMVTSSKRTYATRCASLVCCSQSPCPCSRLLLTCASAGGTPQEKREKDTTLKDEPRRSVGDQCATGEEQNSSRRNEQTEPKWKCPVMECLVVKVKSDAVKNNIAQKPGMLGPRIKENLKWLNKRWQE